MIKVSLSRSAPGIPGPRPRDNPHYPGRSVQACKCAYPHTPFCTKHTLEIVPFQPTWSRLLFHSCLAFHCVTVPKPT